MQNITWFNKNFRFVFEPKGYYLKDGYNRLYDESVRFLIGAGSMPNYIGEKNAETVLKAAEKMKTDKHTIKFRKYGKIEIYLK